MQTILLLSTLLFSWLAGLLALHLQQRFASWEHRRLIHCLVLALPLISLGVSVCTLHALIDHSCLPMLPCRITPDGLLALAILLMTMLALLWGIIRWGLATWVMRGVGASADSSLQSLVQACAMRVGTRAPLVRLLPSEQPVACTTGWLRPRLLLSCWMVKHLDQRELEAVITHELIHVARWDSLVLWLGRVLRDAFWYVPTSRRAYHLLEQDKELSCDDFTVAVTRRPLTLASALTRVWLQTFDSVRPPTFELVHHLEGTPQQIKERVDRLMSTPREGTPPGSPASSLPALSAFGAAELGLLICPLAFMACGSLFGLLR